MFESSTFESMGAIRTRSRNWMIATFGFNASILALLVAIPLLHPAMLPQIFNPIPMIAPQPVEEPKPIVLQTTTAAVRSGVESFTNPLVAPRQIPAGAWISPAAEPLETGSPMNLGGPIAAPGAGCDPFNCSGLRPVVRPAAPPKPHVSKGVMDGNLIDKVLPIYPPLSRAMRLGGRVELQAIISRSGAIENLRVTSGPAPLRQAAIDAVKQWRYRPYLLNGQPVEVETTIDVDFTLR